MPHRLTAPSPLEPDLLRDDGWDAVSSGSIKSSGSHLDATESTVTHDFSSEVTEQTRITTPGSAENNDHIHGRPSRGSMLGFDKQGQDLYDLNPLEGANNCLVDTVSNVCVLFSMHSFTTDVMDDASATDFTGADADRDDLVIRAQQCIGPGRYEVPLGGSGTHRNQSPDRNTPSTLEANTSWERPEESTEAR